MTCSFRPGGFRQLACPISSDGKRVVHTYKRSRLRLAGAWIWDRAANDQSRKTFSRVQFYKLEQSRLLGIMQDYHLTARTSHCDVMLLQGDLRRILHERCIFRARTCAAEQGFSAESLALCCPSTSFRLPDCDFPVMIVATPDSAPSSTAANASLSS